MMISNSGLLFGPPCRPFWSQDILCHKSRGTKTPQKVVWINM